jgi:aromatic-L-amino-acid decarboxylase
MGNTHPRFWGWVIGTGSPSGMLAEMLAAGMNPNLGGGDHGAVYVEHQVIEWFKTLFGFPSGASGLLVSGGSMANLVGLTVARNIRAPYDVRREGLQGSSRRMTVYGSVEAHSSIQKAIELLGLGERNFRQIAVDDQYRIDLQALERAIREDRAAGHDPFCVVGNAGTVNTGAFDDLQALADLCQREALWLHVDGAFGALAGLSPDLKGLTAGMERADSLAFDMHKWMYMPYEIGCTLIRREPDHRRTFTLLPDYLEPQERGLGAEKFFFGEYGVQLSRGFRALKAWMLIKEHGIRKYGRLIHQNVHQARYLADLVDQHPDLERMAPVPLNIVCLRFNPGSLDPSALNHLNEEILLRLHERGIALPSYTMIDGQYVLRVAITNHRSRLEDFDLLVHSVADLGQEMVKEGQ